MQRYGVVHVRGEVDLMLLRLRMTIVPEMTHSDHQAT